jgi:hypothetical protein
MVVEWLCFLGLGDDEEVVARFVHGVFRCGWVM